MSIFHSHHHSHSHGEGCNHDHGHTHAVPETFQKAFLFGILLNITYVILEAAYGIFSNSLALIADAGHNFSDVIGLVLSWTAIKLAAQKPSEKYTYGLKRASILASLANAVLLLISVGVILVESIKKIITPEPVQSTAMMVVAGAGIIINAMTAVMFMRGRHGDLNIRSAFLHMAADAAISLGVVVAGVLIFYTGWNWLDPVMGIAIALVIVAGTWSLLHESFALAVDAVPHQIKHQAVKDYFMSLNGVIEIHDLHIWAISTTEVALTTHLVLDLDQNINALLKQINHDLQEKFTIHHSTIQVEHAEEAFQCDLRSGEIICTKVGR